MDGGISQAAGGPALKSPALLYRGDANEYASRVQCGQVNYPGSPALWRNL
jgi:hypothetical protein